MSELDNKPAALFDIDESTGGGFQKAINRFLNYFAAGNFNIDNEDADFKALAQASRERLQPLFQAQGGG
ncbi:MAG: hypothetical protein LBU45_08360 [Azoarcus sp.]|jgi:hypothetical protein|nr:hypothetical protein [Azoarcus sp.]